MNPKLQSKLQERIDESYPELDALGALRYEALRRLQPMMFTELHRRCVAGENFDGMIDQLILDPEFLRK